MKLNERGCGAFCDGKCSNKASKVRAKAAVAAAHEAAGVIACPVCGKEIPALNRQGHRRKYCSMECRGIAMVQVKAASAAAKREETSFCKQCHQVMPKYDAVKGKEKAFCSKECYRLFSKLDSRRLSDEARQARRQQCDYCGMLIDFAMNHRFQRFCSSYCKNHYHAVDRRLSLNGRRYRLSPKDARRLLEMKYGLCCYCGSDIKLSLEHIIPVKRGGTHGFGNFSYACKRCNSSKNKKTVMEWRLWLLRKLNVPKDAYSKCSLQALVVQHYEGTQSF